MVGTAKNDDGNIPYSALSPEQRRRYDLLLAGLDLLDQAIAVFDATPKLVTWNKAMLRLLDFPESMVRVGTPFEEFARFNAERGEYGPGDIDTLVRARVAAQNAHGLSEFTELTDWLYEHCSSTNEGAVREAYLSTQRAVPARTAFAACSMAKVAEEQATFMSKP